jgi:hypothetical protein
VLEHPGEGWFARVLDHSAPGRLERYEPEPMARAKASGASRWMPQPLVKPDVPRAKNGKPRWTQERIDALPVTSGFLTRTDAVIVERKGTSVVCRCDGKRRGCTGRAVVHAPLWAKDSTRPKSCKGCSRAGSRAMVAPYSDKGFANAREYAAREKGRAA